MGHLHLLVLPKSRAWREVVDLLTGGSVDVAVIAASAKAAERDLARATDNPVFVEAVRLLLMIPHAARSKSFAMALRETGLDIRSEPELIELVTAVGMRLDEVARESRNRSDMGELAGRALIATLTDRIGEALPGLFEATPGDVQSVAKRLSGRRGIAELSRDFFGRLISESLAYWLDRKLSTEVGPGRRFGTAAQRSEFDVALAQYASEATRIIQEFAPGWFGKRIHEDGRITTHEAARFGAVCFKKIAEELRLKRGGDD